MPVPPATHQVYVSDGEVWDATLNQTVLAKNANKYVILMSPWGPCSRFNVHCHRFYVLQLLHPIGNSSSCVLLTRWGRVGEIGASQRKVKHPFAVAEAISYGILFRAHSRLLSLFLSSRNSSNPRRPRTGRIADQ